MGFFYQNTLIPENIRRVLAFVLTSPKPRVVMNLPLKSPIRLAIILYCCLVSVTATVSASGLGKPPLGKPSLMLANIYRQNINLANYLVSEKYDGVRALWDGKELMSRSGHVYHAPRWFTEPFPPQPLDGELWMGRQQFEPLVSAVRSQHPDDAAWRKVKFMVFDLPGSAGVFSQRLERLRRIIDAANTPWLRLVKQDSITSHKELMRKLDKITKAGAEGLMLHRTDSLYRGARSDDLLKLKPYMDAEATVIKQLPGKGKYTGMLGALLVETSNGTRFKIGTGFSDKQRRSPPPVGAVITYQYRGLTRKGVPRFASFLRIREKL